MLCELCKKNLANGYVQIPLDCTTRKVAVCSECYHEYVSEFESNSKICRYCGRSFWEIKQTAIVGCEYCYEQFHSQLNGRIRKVQHL